MKNDVLLRLSLLAQHRDRSAPKNLHRQTLQTIEQSSQQILNLVSKGKQLQKLNAANDVLDPHVVKRLLVVTFSDRLCRRRSLTSDKALMVGGRGVKLSADSVVVKSEFFLALNGIETQQGSETTVSMAAGLDKNFVLKMLPDYLGEPIEKIETLSFDRDKGQFYIRSNKVFKDLILEEGSVSIATADQVADHLPQALTSEWEWVLKENEHLRKWIERLSFLVRKRELVSSKPLQEKLEVYSGGDLFTLEQKTRAFTEAASGEKDFHSVASKNLIPYFESLLDSSIAMAMQELVPAKLKVPSGSMIEIQYTVDRDPFIEVRIQEVFGWKEAPKLMNGNQVLTLSLLGPNYRPMQITNNLASFWQTAYSEVRKELRLRYPKHSWPEDPLTAVAVAKGRSTKS